MRSYGLTDVGITREINQDVIYVSNSKIGPLPNVFLVADGMGGEKAGDIASKYTVGMLLEYLKQCKDKPIEAINGAITYANHKVFRLAKSREAYTGMGSTCVLATVLGDRILLANIGDSRAYLIEDTEINQITRDHSYVEEMVEQGRIEANSDEYKKKKSWITRAVGATNEIQADYYMFELPKNAIVLLCSDGLTNMLNDDEIYYIVKRSNTLKEAGMSLVEMANRRGGKDNISVVLISEVGGVRKR